MISVIMPVFNEEPTDLEESIESILNQTYKKIELIIILDNPSNQKLDMYLKEYKLKDDRIKYLKNKENIGIGLTLNRGINESKFDIIARLDADDISQLNRLEIQYNYLLKYNDVSMVSTNCINIDENGKVLGRKGSIPEKNDQIKMLLPFGSTIIHSSVMYRKSDVELLGGYRQLLNCQDYDLWLRMIDKGLKIESIDEPLTKYRIRTSSITVSQSMRSFLTEQYVRELHRERLEKGYDSFSFDNYLLYLKKNGYENETRKNRYSDAINLYNVGINQLQRKKFVNGSIQIIKGIFKDILISVKIKNMIVYRIKRRKIM